MKKIILFALFLPLQIYALDSTQPYNILNDLNSYRKEHNLEPLEENKKLCLLAKTRVEHLKTNWSHDGFQSEIDIITDMDGLFYENLARNFIASDVVLAWSMSTQGHNEAMIIPEMKYGCVAQIDDYYTFEGYIPKKR